MCKSNDIMSNKRRRPRSPGAESFIMFLSVVSSLILNLTSSIGLPTYDVSRPVIIGLVVAVFANLSFYMQLLCILGCLGTSFLRVTLDGRLDVLSPLILFIFGIYFYLAELFFGLIQFWFQFDILYPVPDVVDNDSFVPLPLYYQLSHFLVATVPLLLFAVGVPIYFQMLYNYSKFNRRFVFSNSTRGNND